MKRISWANLQPHFIACAIFLAVSFFYYYPTLTGKRLVQNDVVQSAGSLKEVRDYKEKGDPILWTNSMFSGMPIWTGKDSNVLQYVHKVVAAILPSPVILAFLAFLGFYLMMLPFKAPPVVAFMASAAFAFSSFNIISLEAGHINKVYDMALMAPVLAGIFLAYKKKYVEGALMTAFFLGLHIYYGHFQITYYLFIVVLFYFISELIFTALDKNWQKFVKASAILGISAIIAVIPNISKLYTNYEYSKSTTRGGSELTSRDKTGDKGGLEKEYALAWSNGVDEVLTIYVPYLYGGSSHESLSKKSETGKALRDADPAQAKQFLAGVPLYFGPQPFTSGPVYFGAVIVFLFIVGLIVVEGRAKWWILAISLFSLFMSMGKHFPALTDVLFYNFPLYNKFRSVTMAMSIAQLTFPLMAGLAVVKIIRGEVDEKKLKIALGTALGVCLLIVFYAIIVPTGMSESDKDMKLPDWLMEAIIEDRVSMARNDAFRSFFISLIAAGLIWAWFKKWMNPQYALIALTFVAIVDLVWVDKRYLGAEDFKSAKTLEREVYAPTGADEFILKDKDYFRVYNVTKSPFNDATTSWFHHSIGGYSAIKLGRYQELIENHLQKNNMAVLNMLNARYFIVPDNKTGQEVPQRNPDALGNAWFVKEYKIVKNADEEIEALNGFDPAKTAFIDKRFEKQLTGLNLQYDSTASVKFVSYHPDRLSYEYTTPTDQLLVFSEIYYQPGWNAYLDGKPVDHFRCNYVLRGMKAPAGTHKVEFRFEPAHYFTTEKIAFVGSALLIVFIGGLLFLWYKNDGKDQKDFAEGLKKSN